MVRPKINISCLDLVPLGLSNFPPTQPLLCHSRTIHDTQVLLPAGQQRKEVWVAKNRLQVLNNKYPQAPEQVDSPSEQRPRKRLVEGSMGPQTTLLSPPVF